jgi:LytS/YehU family sensor histidine kinase
MFYVNLQRTSFLSVYRENGNWFSYFAFNVAIVFIGIMVGSTIQFILFANVVTGYLGLGYFARFSLTAVLIAILVKIILMLREAQQRNAENEQLKSAYVTAELELLKEQMNPHFLFNSLSSLSGVIREDPNLAQKYVKDLSNVFRYAITRSKDNLVTLGEELTMLRSFAQLITMRLENAFELNIQIPDAALLSKLPHLSLQPLLENAVKHNAATPAMPLKVDIYVQGDKIIVSNNLQEITTPESSNGLGLANLNERFRLMMHNEIDITKSGTHFMVSLPLKR